MKHSRNDAGRKIIQMALFLRIANLAKGFLSVSDLHQRKIGSYLVAERGGKLGF